jgi:transcriptional regulator GlxA family with amidase domain
VAWAWRQLEQSHGSVAIGVLAEEIGWSRRHFVDRFRDHVGLAPKPSARVLRFARASALLTSGRRPVGEVAARCGYADQSHLVRECRRLAGCTPSELAT